MLNKIAWWLWVEEMDWTAARRLYIRPPLPLDLDTKPWMMGEVWLSVSLLISWAAAAISTCTLCSQKSKAVPEEQIHCPHIWVPYAKDWISLSLYCQHSRISWYASPKRSDLATSRGFVFNVKYSMYALNQNKLCIPKELWLASKSTLNTGIMIPKATWMPSSWYFRRERWKSLRCWDSLVTSSH